jgi:hypothetical protein
MKFIKLVMQLNYFKNIFFIYILYKLSLRSLGIDIEAKNKIIRWILFFEKYPSSL